MNDLRDNEHYNPGRLLDTVIERFGLKNDAALCRKLCVAPPLISKIRNRRVPLGDNMLVLLHEETGLSISELRSLMGTEARPLAMRSRPHAAISAPGQRSE